MKKRILGAVFAAATLVSSCGFITDEANYPGGFAARVADDVLFEARAQRQRADRFLMMLAVTGPLAADLSSDDTAAVSAITHINSIYDDIWALYQAAGTCLVRGDNTISPNCQNPLEPFNTAFAYERNAESAQSSFYSLVKFALGQVDLENIAQDVIEFDVLAVIRKAGKAYPIFRTTMSGYRDSITAFGDAVYETCLNDAPDKTDCDKLGSYVAQLRVGSRASLAEFDNGLIKAIRNGIKNATKAGGPAEKWTLKKRHRAGLLFHVDQACTTLEKLVDDPQNAISCSKNENRTRIVGLSDIPLD